MNISSRFSEFGMTGAFFWIAQIIYFALVHDMELQQLAPGWITSLNHYQTLTEALPQTFKDVAGSLLTAFGLIGIFVTGLILNLLGSYFFLFEDIYLNRHLEKNHDWLDKMVNACPGAVHDDYLRLHKEFGANIFVSARQGLKRLRLTGCCTRMQSFLFSYIHVFGDNGSPEALSDHVHLWRTARAIGITFWVLSVEILVFGLHGSEWVAILVSIALFLIAIYTTLRSYNRMCHTLFTLACATYGRQRKQ
ncbi:MAG TPA: hypothetical protein ENI94_02380 [Gammaproteobacteria bacterium]|nr:hypothetical protein [Gammaproteobacteria bacterium]